MSKTITPGLLRDYAELTHLEKPKGEINFERLASALNKYFAEHPASALGVDWGFKDKVEVVPIPKQTLTSGTHTYRLKLQTPKGVFTDGKPHTTFETITARSITAAIALLYEQHPEYSSMYRVVGVEEVPEIKFSKPVRYEFKFGVSEPLSDLDIPLKPITINGAKIIGDALIDILNMVTQPNPRRWYRFERQGELITVHTKQDEDSK